MSTAASASSVLASPDTRAAYQTAYDALGEAYWDATDIQSKDLVYGAQQAIGDILTALNQQQLAANTALFTQLTPKITAVNGALKQVQASIATITKNINTTATLISAISKVLSLFPALA
jgi:hypothetical protein